jgi:hypothetical protein
VLCTPGKYVAQLQVNDASRCADCTASQFSATANAASCTKCITGKYQENRTQTFCHTMQPCGPGKYVADTTSSLPSRCVNCAASQISSESNAASCTRCAAGKYQNKRGQAFCEACTAKEFTIDRNASSTTVETCPPSINPDKPEVLCGEGLFTFNNGSWHDGLRPANASQSIFSSSVLSSPFSRTPIVFKQAMRFYVCPKSSACTFPNDKTGELVCAGNTAGPLCALCAPGYSSGKEGCSKCGSADELPWSYIIIAAIVLLAVVVRKYLKMRGKAAAAANEPATQSSKPHSVWANAIKRLRPVFKQCIR